MNRQRIVGTALLVVGIVLFVIGVNASDSFADQWSNFFTGRFTDSTVWYMAGGIACAVVGFLMVAFGGGRGATA